MPDLGATKVRNVGGLVFLCLIVCGTGCIGRNSPRTKGVDHPFEPEAISVRERSRGAKPALGEFARGKNLPSANAASSHLGPHATGMAVVPGQKVPPPNVLPVATEQRKRVLPPYVLAPPDVLQLSSGNLLPKPDRPIRPLDVISVEYPVKALKDEQDQQDLILAKLPIAANFTVELDGTIRVGTPYDISISVANLSAEQASLAVAKGLKKVIQTPRWVDEGTVEVKLVQAGGLQAIQGQHLVRGDGTIGLGTYGSVFVTGLTIPQAKNKIEEHLSEFLQDPIMSVDIVGFNSQVYYVLFDGGGLGEQLIILPVTGNETVLDAIGQVNGLPAVASRSHVWVARPGPSGEDGAILPVNWRDITQRGITKTNYQLLPGDRVYVRADPLITLNTYFDRFLAPVERVFGAILLGNSTFRSLQGNEQGIGLIGGF
ncbi:MAG: polysaccharide biosynthesis/export family protein [Gemmataceae bacterium]